MTCQECEGYCCKYYTVLINSSDARRITSQLNARISPLKYLTLHDKEIGKGENPIVQLKGKKEGVFGIKKKKDESCYFLNKSGFCDVHAFKPLVCLLYPYRIDNPICPKEDLAMFQKTMESEKWEPVVDQLYDEDQVFVDEIKKWNADNAGKDFADLLRFLKILK